MEKEHQIIKHSSTIAIANSMSFLARKCWNILLYNAYNDLKFKDQFEIKAMDLMKYLEFKSHNTEYLKNTLKSLTGTVIEFNQLGKDKDNHWVACSLLPFVEMKNGVIRYEFVEELQQKLIDNEMYVRIKLSIQNKLTSKYALALYELCLDYYDRRKETSYTPRMSVPKFRLLILGDEEKYKNNFRDLNKFVIQKIVKEINEKSDLEIKLIKFLYRRVVDKIQFEIKKKSPNRKGLAELKKKRDELFAMPKFDRILPLEKEKPDLLTRGSPEPPTP